MSTIAQRVVRFRRWRQMQSVAIATNRAAAEQSLDRFAAAVSRDVPSAHPPKARGAVRGMLAAALTTGEPHILSGAAADLVLDQAPKCPADTTLRRTLMRCPVGFLFFDGQRPAMGESEGHTWETAAIGWVAYDAERAANAFVYGFAQTTAGGLAAGPVAMVRWQYGRPLVEPEDEANEMVNGINAHLLTALILMEQKILVPARPRDRQERRQMQRESVTEAERVIVLRERESPARGTGGTGSPLTCRYVVSSFWNRFHIKSGHELFEPSGPEDQIISHLIASHVRGDPALPLRIPAGRVFDVRR